MTILPGLTTTRKEGIPRFLSDLRRLGISRIALFPTCLDPAERLAMYRELEQVPGLVIPHVHLRADMDEAEVRHFRECFGTEVFNIHPAASQFPFRQVPDGYERRIFVENSMVVPEPEEMLALGGLCPDFAHWENDGLQGRADNDRRMRDLATRFAVGCCHLSAIRVGDPNPWAGEWDHHVFRNLDDFSYLGAYREIMPEHWASLEVENSLEEQLAAVEYLAKLLG